MYCKSDESTLMTQKNSKTTLHVQFSTIEKQSPTTPTSDAIEISAKLAYCTTVLYIARILHSSSGSFHLTRRGFTTYTTQLVASMAGRQCRSGVAQLKNPERCSTRHHEYAELQKTLLGNNDVSAGICSSVFVPNSDLATHSNDLLCFPAESTGAGLGCPRHPRHRPIL